MGICCQSNANKNEFVRTGANMQDLKQVYVMDQTILGKGSFGTVYKGTNRHDDNMKSAIKAIDKRRLSPEEIDDIHNEVKTLMKVDHAHIINYYETYQDDRFVYLVMELCTGGELIDECKAAGSFSEVQAADIFIKLLGALNHIHAQGLIHRDIKPENIMFDRPKGTVKFIDFGLACQMSKGTKELAGTPYYIAPEVIVEKYDHQCDIWSLGVVLYLMMSGKLPFVANNQKDLFRRIREKDFAMPKEFSPDLQDLIGKMLTKDPTKRITAVDAMGHHWFQNAHATPEVETALQNTIMARLTQFHGRSKLRKAAMQLLVKQMSESNFEELRAVFNEIDKDKSGTIDHNELKRALTDRSRGLADLQGDTVKGILDELDMNKTNTVGYTEFIAAAIDPKLVNNETMLRGLFQQFDIDGSGHITAAELHKSFSKFGQNITEAEVRAVMAAHDRNKDGLLSFEGFKCMILDEYHLPQHIHTASETGGQGH